MKTFYSELATDLSFCIGLLISKIKFIAKSNYIDSENFLRLVQSIEILHRIKEDGLNKHNSQYTPIKKEEI